MATAAATITRFSGTLHNYLPGLVAFEYSTQSSSEALNTLIFIGGLGDGLCTIPFVTDLVATLSEHWRVVQVLLTSSYTGWGTSSLAKDAEEISSCVAYFRTLGSKRVVLMGHSTGCQDCLEYVVGPRSKERARIEGVVLQSPISDREAMVHLMDGKAYDQSAALAKEMIANGQGDLPLSMTEVVQMFGAPCSASRWYSLASPPPAHDGADDYFSSDLDDARIAATFGRWTDSARTGQVAGGPPLLILYGGEDEFVPPSVDKNALVTRWTQAIQANGGSVDTQNGGIVPGATHNLARCPDGVVADVMARVSRFCEICRQGSGTDGAA